MNQLRLGMHAERLDARVTYLVDLLRGRTHSHSLGQLPQLVVEAKRCSVGGKEAECHLHDAGRLAKPRAFRVEATEGSSRRHYVGGAVHRSLSERRGQGRTVHFVVGGSGGGRSTVVGRVVSAPLVALASGARLHAENPSLVAAWRRRFRLLYTL